MQQNRIENLVLDTFSKNFVILVFFDKFQHISFDKQLFEKKKKNGTKPLASIGISVDQVKSKILLLLMR